MDGWSATSLGPLSALSLPLSPLSFARSPWRVIVMEAAFVGLIKLRSVARSRW